jgi:hemolysin-activating ACP:hemolysin acyltransferase
MRLGPAPERSLRHGDGLGAAVDMMRHLNWHGRLPISTVVPLILQALRDGRAHFALTDDDRPWGLAVWHWVSDATHPAWLAAPPTLARMAQLSEAPYAPETLTTLVTHLWFSLLVTPFCASLPLLHQLRQRLPQAQRAWAITPYGAGCDAIRLDATPQVRPVW